MFGARSKKLRRFSLLTLLLPAIIVAKDIADLNLNLFSGPVSIVGKWAPDPDMIGQAYNKVTPALFGAYYLLNDEATGPAVDAAGKPISPVRTQHYIVGKKQGVNLVGYRVLPLVNRVIDDNTFAPSPYYPTAEKNEDGRAPQTADGEKIS